MDTGERVKASLTLKSRFRGAWFWLMMVPFLVSACGASGSAEDGVIMTIGKRGFTTEELKKDLRRITSDLDMAAQGKTHVSEGLVNLVVDHYLVLEYGKEKGIVVSDEELETAVAEVQKDYLGADFRDVLLKRCIDLEEWKAGLREQILIQKIMKKVSEEVAPVSSEEIMAYFDSHPNEFRNPPMVKLRHIVTSTKGKAQEILRRLTKGEKMEDLARKHSTSPDGEKGGDLGWVARGQLEESMERTIFSLWVGQTSPVLETPYGYHIFEVVSKRPEGLKGFPEAMAEIELKLSSQKEEAFYRTWLKELKDLYPVKVNQRLLAKLEWE
jgi:parvulin-like peptidyl-prolyl isomerase